uniref:Uncharacterized protein n=1 Tax=Arundo donax TaxID=35708 RepID=A0A0A8Z5P3_ARUDO
MCHRHRTAATHLEPTLINGRVYKVFSKS